MDLKTIGIGVGVIASVIGLKKYFDAKHRESSFNRNSRINSVLEKYYDLYHSGKNKSISAFQIAGIRTLKDDSEAKDLLARLASYLPKDPLGKYRKAIEKIGILKFFEKYTDYDQQKENFEDFLTRIKKEITK